MNKLITQNIKQLNQTMIVSLSVLFVIAILTIGKNLININKGRDSIEKLELKITVQKELHKDDQELKALVQGSDKLVVDRVLLQKKYDTLDKTIEAIRTIAKENKLRVKFSEPAFCSDKEVGRQLSINVKLVGDLLDSVNFIKRIRYVSSVMKIVKLNVETVKGRQACSLTVLVATNKKKVKNEN